MAVNKKKNDLKAAKDRRNKKILIVGSVVLVALLAIQVPRTMKMLGGPDTEAAPAVAAPASTPAPAADPNAVPVAAEAATLTNVDVAPEPEAGQLESLGRFSTKDPFVQQVSEESSSTGAPSTSQSSTATPSATPTSSPSASGSVTMPSAPSVGSSAGSPPTGGTPTVATPVSAVIAVNGVEQAVSVKSDFPEDDPTFRLVALTPKSAKIGIAGGTLAGGAGTVTLRVGKTVTLMNTVDGTRYEIELRSVS